MSDDNNNFWKWIAGILAGIIVYYLTEGAFWNPGPTPIGTTPRSSTHISTPTPSSSPGTYVPSDTGVAIVYDPPSNVRDSPNGEILCSVKSRTPINIYDSTNSWYRTDICGKMGVIHESQITFSPN